MTLRPRLAQTTTRGSSRRRATAHCCRRAAAHPPRGCRARSTGCRSMGPAWLESRPVASANMGNAGSRAEVKQKKSNAARVFQELTKACRRLRRGYCPQKPQSGLHHGLWVQSMQEVSRSQCRGPANQARERALVSRQADKSYWQTEQVEEKKRGEERKESAREKTQRWCWTKSHAKHGDLNSLIGQLLHIGGSALPRRYLAATCGHRSWAASSCVDTW